MGKIIPSEEVAAAEKRRAREELENTWCNPDAPDCERTLHRKKFTGLVSDMSPPLYHWVCELCGYRGYDRGEKA